MVGLEILVQIQSGKRQEFLQMSEWFQNQLTKTCDGACSDLTFFEAVGKPNHFLLIEKWTDLQPLEVHMNTDRFRTLLGAIEVLGELIELQVVAFKTASSEIR
jgi:quinol monooxygenase YgiN